MFQAKESKNGKEGAGPDPKELGKAVTNLLGGENSPLPGKNMLSNVLYKALTQGSVQGNDTSGELDLLNPNGTLKLTQAQSAAIGGEEEYDEKFYV